MDLLLYSIWIEKHLQCEKLLHVGLAGGNTKKHGKQEIRQEQNSNPLQRHSHVANLIISLDLAVFHAIWWFSKANRIAICHIGGRVMFNSLHTVHAGGGQY